MGQPIARFSDEELRAFVGNDGADYYHMKWMPELTTGRIKTGWNWAAFFLGLVWVVYRRMYKIAAILLGVISLESLLEYSLFVIVFEYPEVPKAVDNIFLLYMIVFGAYGNYWYFKRAEKIIAEVHKLGLSEYERNLELGKRGGTNFSGALAVLSLAVVVFGLILYL